MSEPKETLTRQDVIDIVVERMKAVSARTSMSQAPNQVFQQQADALVIQTSAGSGTLYEWSTDGTQDADKLLGSQKNVRIISIQALDNWSVDTTTLEVHVTIDGQTITYTVDPDDNTAYFAEINPSAAATAQTLTASASSVVARAFLLEGRSVKVEIESTGGTSDSLQLRVKWAKIP